MIDLAVIFVQEKGLRWDFSYFRNSDRLAGTFRWSEDPACWKQVFSRQIRELKIQRKNLGSVCVQEVSKRGSQDSDTSDKIFPFQKVLSSRRERNHSFSEGPFDLFSLFFISILAPNDVTLS
jgi:hypothetical protein